MPRESKVGRCFDKLTTEKKMPKAKAAAICTKSTGQALSTGRKPKGGAKKSK